MKRADIIGGLIVVLFGAAVIHQALDLEYRTRFGPGPGFVPVWSGVIIIIGGLLLLLQAARRPAESRKRLSAEDRKRLLAVGAVIGITVLAGMGMHYLGFTATMFLFMVLLAGWFGKLRWWVNLAASAFIAISFYVLFAYFMQVPLPTGWLGF